MSKTGKIKPDVVFVSYDEPNADAHFERLKTFAPHAKRLHGVDGIANAYREAGKLSQTPYFFMVDADNFILEPFKFDYPSQSILADIHIWHSVNAVNGIKWFNGCIKLLKSEVVETINPRATDFFSSLRGTRRQIGLIASETRFNSTPFSAWKTGFRECAKFASGEIKSARKEELLYIWQTVGAHQPNGHWCMLGAKMGVEFGQANNSLDDLAKINDLNWLRAKFEEASSGPCDA